MKGDFTRITDRNFVKRYTDVLRQQGRVDLDADWNEHVALRDRLARITATDVIGPTGAPKTGGGFAVGISADGRDLTLSAGRMYVDGILCELDAEATPQHPAVREALTEVDPPVGGRTDLVYLDVWQRHVTAVEDPELLDPALNGLDTTTRLQTVWQLRVLKGDSDITCDAVPGFPPAPSGARLTFDAVGAPEEDNPCEVVVAGGYRGVENRLYRVEIHNRGDMGAATWKWSRDNGAVLFAVEEFIANPGSRLRLRTLGRDAVLTLRQDDWVEILDDASELAFTPGFMAQVTKVDPGTRIVTLDRDVPAGTFEVKRARVRRWDQVRDVDADGLLATNAGPVDLEDGVQVAFSGGDYRTGDYWTFVARTAAGTVEKLTDAPPAPPQGIRHHYAPLALVRWNDEGDRTFTVSVVKDCRATFPPLTAICADDVCYDNTTCDLGAETVQQAIEVLCRHGSRPASGGLCTVTLGVDVGDLQDAVDRLPMEEGGCICIPAGTFHQRQTVAIRGRKAITIKGCGPASVIEYEGEGTDLPLLTIQGSSEILLHGFTAHCENQGFAVLEESSRVRIVDCTLTCRQGVALEVRGRGEEVSMEGCFVAAQRALVLAVRSELNGVLVQGNRLQASEQVEVVQSHAVRLICVRIEGNTIEGSGLFFGFLPKRADVTIGHNRVISRHSPAVHLGALGRQALLTLTENQIGTFDDPAGQGVVVEEGMEPEATLMLQGNHVITVREAIVVRSSEGSGELQVNANVLRSLESIPVVSVGGAIDQGPGIAHLLFNNNQVYTERLPVDRCTVELNAARLVVMGNYVADPREGHPRGRSICLPERAEAATAIGNVSGNGVNLEGMPVTPQRIVVNNAVN